MRLKNGVLRDSSHPHPSSAFILIKLESAVGQIVLAKVWLTASMPVLINAKGNPKKQAIHQEG